MGPDRGLLDVTRRGRGLALVLALLLALGGWAGAGPASGAAARGVDTVVVEDGQGDTDEALWAGIAPDMRDEVYDLTAGSLSRYRIAVEITPATGETLTRLEGTVDLLFVNPLDRDLDEVVFRLYANDPRYAEGGLSMTDVGVGGESVAAELSEDETVVTVALPDELAPGEAVDITYAFSGEVDNDPAGSYGMYTFSPASGTLAIAHWYPALAGITPAGEWKDDPVTVLSDPIYSNTGLFDVTVTMPESWQVAASGAEVDTRVDGEQAAHQFITGPSRDFTIVADETFQRRTADVGDTTVVSWFEPDEEAGGEQVLDAGVATLETFEPVLGDYPYTEMDLVQVSVGNGAAGIEFPQLMFIGGSYYGDGRATPPAVSYLDTLVIHEVVHQWFYGLVGNDQYEDGWQDESLTNYLMVYFYALAEDEDTFEVAYLSEVEITYLRYLFNVNDVVVDAPAAEFESGSDYVIAAYYKGAVGFHALREAIGDEAFQAGLAAYVAGFRFAVATPEDLLAAFEEASGEDLGDLWANWFQETNGLVDFSPADLEAAEARVAELLRG